MVRLSTGKVINIAACRWRVEIRHCATYF